MFFVPLYIEILRSRPLLLFWLAALAQAAVWIAVPMLFYEAPPGDLPQLLAIGHEFQLHAPVGPPLAYWLAEVAFRTAGLFGVYALSQLCVVVTYWCVFALGRAIVGPPQAAMAVLLMVGISLFTVPTPEFGPPILAMALWALVLMFYWRAAMLRRRWCWYAFGVAVALLLLTSEAALILLGTLVLYIAVTKRGRATLSPVDPWIVGIALVPFLFVHLLWLMGMDISLAPAFDRLHDAAAGRDNTFSWLRLLAVLALAHAGLVILVVMASGWPRTSANPAPTITRTPVGSDAVTFVKVIALVPAIMATIIAVLLGQRTPVGGAAPLVVLSALAVIVVAGDSIEVFHQRVLGYAWAGLLIVPALFVPAALAAPSRPSVYNDADPARSPWVTPDDIRQKGAVVVWLTSDTTPTPPPEIREHFPDLVPEVPRAFDRPIQGRLPTLRVGWGVIRPGSVASAQ
ncbi:MAG: glycosyltransferase family 39 protein [Xanthobacteraceae bacterium]